MVCTICDMEPQQQRFCRILGVSEERPYFDHPTSGDPVFFMYDPPHLMKSMRNALMNYDIGFDGDSIASWNFIKALWTLDTARSLRLVPRLAAKHIFLGLGKKMSVRLAVQTFSHSVHAGLMAYKEHGLLPCEAEQTANFVKTMNDLWDAFNCSDLHGRGFKQVITRGNLSARLDLLERASSFIKSFVFHRSSTNLTKTHLPSKLGFLITISAFKALICRLLCPSCPQINFVIGRRFNQDCVENCFAQVRRDKGSFYEMLPCWRALVNLKCVAASSFLSPVRKFNANCESDHDINLVDIFQASTEREPHKQCELLDLSFNKVPSSCIALPTQRKASQAAIRELWSDASEKKRDPAVRDATEYVSGYLIQKLFSKNSDVANCAACILSLTAATDDLSTFFKHKSFSDTCRLQCPSIEFVMLIAAWERTFCSIFNSVCRSGQLKLRIAETIFQKSSVSFLPDCHKAVVAKFCLELFVKLRIFKEVKTANEHLKRERIASLRKMSKLSSSLRNK